MNLNEIAMQDICTMSRATAVDCESIDVCASARPPVTAPGRSNVNVLVQSNLVEQ